MLRQSYQVAGYQGKKSSSKGFKGTATRRSPWSRGESSHDEESEEEEEEEEEVELCFDDGFDQLQNYREGLEEVECMRYIARGCSSSSDETEEASTCRRADQVWRSIERQTVCKIHPTTDPHLSYIICQHVIYQVGFRSKDWRCVCGSLWTGEKTICKVCLLDRDAVLKKVGRKTNGDYQGLTPSSSTSSTSAVAKRRCRTVISIDDDSDDEDLHYDFMGKNAGLAKVVAASTATTSMDAAAAKEMMMIKPPATFDVIEDNEVKIGIIRGVF